MAKRLYNCKRRDIIEKHLHGSLDISEINCMNRSYTRHAHIRNIREKLPNKSFIIRLLTSVLRIRTNLRLHSFCGQFLELIVLSRWNILRFVVAFIFAIAETKGVVFADRRVASCGKRLPFA